MSGTSNLRYSSAPPKKMASEKKTSLRGALISNHQLAAGCALEILNGAGSHRSPRGSQSWAVCCNVGKNPRPAKPDDRGRGYQKNWHTILVSIHITGLSPNN